MKKLNGKWWLRGQIATSVIAGATILESRAYQEGGTLVNEIVQAFKGSPKDRIPAVRMK